MNDGDSENDKCQSTNEVPIYLRVISWFKF